MSQRTCKYIHTLGKNKGNQCDKKCVKNSQFCRSHNMGRCLENGCQTRAIFGFEGGNAKYCFKHKDNGMIDVKNKTCQYEGCKKRPSYGIEGKNAKYCIMHREDYMIDVVNKKCKSLDLSVIIC